VESGLTRVAAERPAGARSVTDSERSVIDEACMRARLHDGEAGYDRCVEDQIADLAQLESKPSLVALTDAERSTISDGCDSVGAFYGPAAFYRCAQERLAELGPASRARLATADAARGADHR